jgi:hypothetical protein
LRYGHLGSLLLPRLALPDVAHDDANIFPLCQQRFSDDFARVTGDPRDDVHGSHSPSIRFLTGRARHALAPTPWPFTLLMPAPRREVREESSAAKA